MKVTLERVIPLWQDEIAPKLLDGKNVIIAAHGNSLRALSKYIENISDEDIMGLEMATGQPVVYDFDEKLNGNEAAPLIGAVFFINLSLFVNFLIIMKL